MDHKNLDDLTVWVLEIDRRLIVLKTICEKRFKNASSVASETNRSIQNINYTMRELEKKGLVKCITPEKRTWKKFIVTEKGVETFQKLKDNRFID